MGMRQIMRMVAALLLTGACVHYVWLLTTQSNLNSSQSHVPSDTKAEAAQYFCPMHPSVTSDHPGTCPICGMALQLAEGHTATDSTTRKIAYYRHPMGQPVTSPTPMKDEMGMDFIPVYEDELRKDNGQPLEGRVGFPLSEANQQLIGVRKAVVARQVIDYEIRSSGRVAFDPALYSAVSDYRIALEALNHTKGAAAAVRHNAETLVAAAKLKLQLLGISAEQLKGFGSATLDPTNLLLPDGRVWVYADVYEYELPYLKVGQEIVADSSLFSTEHFNGSVISVSPVIDPNTRTISIKTEVTDAKKLLKPDMFLTVRIKVPLGAQLTVPEDSLIHTGDSDLVFLFGENDRFKPQQVKVGLRTKGQAVILSGLSEGDTVATGANFLLDSESRLRAVLGKGNQ